MEKQLHFQQEEDQVVEENQIVKPVNHSRESQSAFLILEALVVNRRNEMQKLNNSIKLAKGGNAADIHYIITHVLEREAMAQHGEFSNSHYVFNL